MTHEWEEEAHEHGDQPIRSYSFEDFATKLVNTLEVVNIARSGKLLALSIDLRYLPDDCLKQICKKLDGLTLSYTGLNIQWLQEQDLPKQALAAFRPDHMRDFSLLTSDDVEDKTPGPRWKGGTLDLNIEAIGEFQPWITSFSHRFIPGDWRAMPYITPGFVQRIATAFPRLRDLTFFGLTSFNDDPVGVI